MQCHVSGRGACLSNWAKRKFAYRQLIIEDMHDLFLCTGTGAEIRRDDPASLKVHIMCYVTWQLNYSPCHYYQLVP